MANTPTREPAGAATAARLSADEVTDEADTSPRAEQPKLVGKRIRGIAAVITKSGDRATTIEIRPRDLERADGPALNKTLKWDDRRDNCTLPVGDGDRGVPEDVAEFLTKNYPTSFEYINQD